MSLTYLDPQRLTAIHAGGLAALIALDQIVDANIADPEAKHNARETVRVLAEGLNFAQVKANHGPNSAELATPAYVLDGTVAPEYPGFVPFRPFAATSDPAADTPETGCTGHCHPDTETPEGDDALIVLGVSVDYPEDENAGPAGD